MINTAYLTSQCKLLWNHLNHTIKLNQVLEVNRHGLHYLIIMLHINKVCYLSLLNITIKVKSQKNKNKKLTDSVPIFRSIRPKI